MSTVVGERDRLAAVARYGIIDTPAEPSFDRIASLAARWFDTPIATVTIVDAHRMWFKASRGLEGITQVPRSPGLADMALLTEGPYVVSDTRCDPAASVHPLVTGPPGVRFYAAAPLITHEGYRLGTVDVWDTRPRHADAEQLAALQDLAAVVMDELEERHRAVSTVHAERRRRKRAEAESAESELLAATLQRMLAPPQMPAVPGLELASHLRTVGPRQIGGDFYDVFALPGGRWAFVMGDVCGKGAEAASLTALIRYTVRAQALHDPAPVAVLSALNRILLSAPAEGRPGFCTAMYGLLEREPASGPEAERGFGLVLGSGGHPCAYLLRAGGAVESVRPVGGMLVGALAEATFAERGARLGPGDALLLYTDGLTEARAADGSLFGEDGLAGFLAAHTGRGAAALTEAIIALLNDLGSAVCDDVAVVALAVPTAGPSDNARGVPGPRQAEFSSEGQAHG